MPFRDEVIAVAWSYEQAEFSEHLPESLRRFVAPVYDALRGIASAKEVELGALGEHGSQFTCDLDEQAAGSMRDEESRVFGGNLPEQFQPLFERHAGVVLVRHRARQDEDDMVDNGEGGPGERKMGFGRRIECAWQNAIAPSVECHKTVVAHRSTRVGTCHCSR